MTPGIGSKLTTLRAATEKELVENPRRSAVLNIDEIRWRKMDIVPPIVGYKAEGDGFKCIVLFTPGKLQSWKIELNGLRPVYYSGTREDKQKMLDAALALINQVKKEAQDGQ